jgi:RecA-family ATPase
MLYKDVSCKQIDWLWYPYIAIGKITLLQGDPGDGKSTMIMNLLAALSRGEMLPDGTPLDGPQQSIYQCSEDSAGDTIKPRFDAANADCERIAFINEDVFGKITLDDEKLQQAIIEFHPRIIVIDPIQSYVDNPVDLLVAGKLRRTLRRIGIWASTYNCAVVLISHLNKNEGTKSLYRNLGSIDLVATARSVLQVERDSDNPNRRIIRQIKNNIGPIGDDIHFEITQENIFHWIIKLNKRTIGKKIENTFQMLPKNKQELASIVLKQLLVDGAVESREVQRVLEQYGIGNKTMQNVKQLLGIKSYRKMRKWYWVMPDHMKHD